MVLPRDKQMNFKGLEIVADYFTGAITGPFAGITALTNNSGGTVNNTVEVVPAATAASTDTSAASLASVNTALTAIKNDIADLTAKINEILAAGD